MYQARRIIGDIAGWHKESEQRRAQAADVMEYYRREGRDCPPLLIALIADEREYPAWLKPLVVEHKEAMKKPVERKPRVSVAKTREQARTIIEALPEIEARGYLDEDGLPPEMMMEERFSWMTEGDDDDGESSEREG